MFQRRDISAFLLLMPHTMSLRRENGDCLSILTQAMQGKNTACPSAKNYNREVKRVFPQLFFHPPSLLASHRHRLFYTPSLHSSF